MAPVPGSSSGPAELLTSKILDETKWMVYCCCGGWGLGPVQSPLVGAESKQLCLRSSVITTDVMAEDGLCGGVAIMLCLTEQCQLPPVEEAPTCACFNKKCGGSKGSTKWKSDLFEKPKIMDDTFWIYYFLCGGCGVNKMDQGLYALQFKELCCRGYTQIEPPVVDGVFCGAVGTECCIWSQFQLPPAPGNPLIALCTWRKNKVGGAPSQEEMA